MTDSQPDLKYSWTLTPLLIHISASGCRKNCTNSCCLTYSGQRMDLTLCSTSALECAMNESDPLWLMHVCVSFPLTCRDDNKRNLWKPQWNSTQGGKKIRSEVMDPTQIMSDLLITHDQTSTWDWMAIISTITSAHPKIRLSDSWVFLFLSRTHSVTRAWSGSSFYRKSNDLSQSTNGDSNLDDSAFDQISLNRGEQIKPSLCSSPECVLHKLTCVHDNLSGCCHRLR